MYVLAISIKPDLVINLRFLQLQKFLEAFASFKNRMTDMERRLAHIVCYAFDDCSNCEGVFKLFEMMGPLLERPLVQQDFRSKYPILLSMYSEELDAAKVIYDKQMKALQSPSGPVINKNMPHVAGLLKWTQELKGRIGTNMEKLKLLNHG
jgi:dynein heavy chain